MFKTLKYSLMYLFVTFLFMGSSEAALSSSVGIQVRAYLPKTQKQEAKSPVFEEASSSLIAPFSSEENGEGESVKLLSPSYLTGELPAYTLKVDSQNGFKLKNERGVELPYTVFVDKQKPSDSSEEADALVFNNKSIEDKALYMRPEKTHPSKQDEGFSDILFVSIKAH